VAPRNEKRALDGDGIVAGADRALARAIAPRVRAEVEAEFAPRLAHAGPWRRFWLLRRMRRAISRRVAREVPRGACYLLEFRPPCAGSR
jgi:hypothetical protein